MEVIGVEEESGPCWWVFLLSAFVGAEVQLVGEEGLAGGLLAFLWCLPSVQVVGGRRLARAALELLALETPHHL